MCNYTQLIDVVIVAYNNPHDIEDLGRTLPQIPVIARITVVDNGDGRSAEVARQHGLSSISLPHNPGFATAQNIGISVGAAPYVLILNPDARIFEGSLLHGLNYMSHFPTIGALQGEIRNRESGSIERSASSGIRPVHIWGRALALGQVGKNARIRTIISQIPSLEDWANRTTPKPVDVESLAATALLIRRRTFESVGGFDTRFFLYGEDVDLSKRLREDGSRLVHLPIPWALHLDGSTATSSWTRELNWFEGTLTFAAKHYGHIGYLSSLLAGFCAGVRLSTISPRLTLSVTYHLGWSIWQKRRIFRRELAN